MLTTENIIKLHRQIQNRRRTAADAPLKAQHQRCQISSAIAQSMEWNEPEDEVTAQSVGLSPWCGQIPQYRDYQTFQDSASIDHGDLPPKYSQTNLPGTPPPTSKTPCSLLSKYHNKRPAHKHDPPHLQMGGANQRRGQNRHLQNGTNQNRQRHHLRHAPPPQTHVEGLSQKLVEEITNTGKGSYANARSLQDYRLIQLTWGCDLNYPVSAITLKSEGIFERICADLKPYGIEELTDKLMGKIEAM